MQADGSLERLAKESDALRQAYGHFFDLTIVNNDISDTIATLELAIEKMHSSSQWVPVGWLYWPDGHIQNRSSQATNINTIGTATTVAAAGITINNGNGGMDSNCNEMLLLRSSNNGTRRVTGAASRGCGVGRERSFDHDDGVDAVVYNDYGDDGDGDMDGTFGEDGEEENECDCEICAGIVGGVVSGRGGIGQLSGSQFNLKWEWKWLRERSGASTNQATNEATLEKTYKNYVNSHTQQWYRQKILYEYIAIYTYI